MSNLKAAIIALQNTQNTPAAGPIPASSPAEKKGLASAINALNNANLINQVTGPLTISPSLAATIANSSFTVGQFQNQPTQGSPNKWDQARINMEEISAQIKSERKGQGLSQRTLARISGMSQGTITRVEKHGWTSITTLLIIAHALGKKIQLTN